MQSVTICFGSQPVHLPLREARARVVLPSINSLVLGNMDDSHDGERMCVCVKIHINARSAKTLYSPCAKPGRDLCPVGTIRRSCLLACPGGQGMFEKVIQLRRSLQGERRTALPLGNDGWVGHFLVSRKSCWLLFAIAQLFPV